MGGQTMPNFKRKPDAASVLPASPGCKYRWLTICRRLVNQSSSLVHHDSSAFGGLPIRMLEIFPICLQSFKCLHRAIVARL